MCTSYLNFCGHVEGANFEYNSPLSSKRRLLQCKGLTMPTLGCLLYIGVARAAEKFGGAQGKCKKVGSHKMDCVRGSGDTPSDNFEILQPLKCVLGFLEALLRACTQCTYIPASCHLQLVVSDRKVCPSLWTAQ